MPPTSSAGSAECPGRHRRAGFVLLEVIPALIIFGLMVMMAFPAIPRGTGAARLLATAVDAAALLRETRTASIASGREQAAVFDTRQRSLSLGGRSVAVPRDVDASLLSGDTCRRDGDRVGILFRPDGTSCGGVLRLAKGPRAFRVRVNWATGNVAILEGV
ncbi:type II secretion system protein GspH [Prosthecomicrobium sp. N25]|uniref:type II secretion system protein GspH n=1 Tax=Prosthecomicrobium sp. N25 TaxID=3129254 RepID=UPI003077777F